MPPRKFKTDHRRGGGSKHVSSFEEVKARNAGEESAYDKARAARAGRAKEEEAEESEEEAKPVRKPRDEVFGEVCNPNAGGYAHVDKHGVELTRKQREEIERQAARRRYEELHKAGKTAEAQADMKRLEEVKKRREEAARKREEEAAAKESKAQDAKEVGKAAVMKELKQAMGKEEDKEAAPAKGDEKEPSKDTEAGYKKQTINGADVADVYSFVSNEKKVKEDSNKNKATDGSIEACRAAEADFM
ncbi:28 kDa heat- and acid-stable phosphoprotein (PDGF-associated protein) (PAP) (PDGFA-associated protein 1) (PAP1) [Durusdinium trenchii]|uniref:28 kDa heat- and acid-stable phosphoprotein (PDGF-associated protein) (PAP) (PDGFA-associated protein 1) (PAP1) n=1 Tax=Durusdinium trenchii TaxID=1381693 RepID=A0ABP0MSP0_9DINO